MAATAEALTWAKFPLSAGECVQQVHVAMLALPYNLLERVRKLVGVHHGEILDESFAADITMTFHIPVESTDHFQKDLSELSAGTLQIETIETTEMLLPI